VNGTLSPKTPATVASDSHPIAVAVTPDGASAYVANNSSSSVTQYDIDQTSGALSPKTPASVATGFSPVGIAVGTPQGYPRPRGAGPFLTYLVPAYGACTAPNRTHGAPLAFGSCAPPTQTSLHLTLGTPDANGHPAGTVGSVRYRVAVGDVKIDVNISSVLTQGTLAPYGGELRLESPLRITDRDNSPGPGPGTVQGFSFPTTVPCATGTCTLATTANALAPGALAAGRRAIWQLGQVRVYDGGADGLASTTGDNTLFMVEGIFVP
jgi:hypothetical protein